MSISCFALNVDVAINLDCRTTFVACVAVCNETAGQRRSCNDVRTAPLRQTARLAGCDGFPF